MEQCLRAEAGKHRLLAPALFRDCSMQLARGAAADSPQRPPATAGKLRHGAGITEAGAGGNQLGSQGAGSAWADVKPRMNANERK